MTLAEEIAALHVRMVRAEDACHSGEVEFYRFEIHRLEDERDAEERRAVRRQLSRDFAQASWRGQVDEAARVQALIDRWERGQP